VRATIGAAISAWRAARAVAAYVPGVLIGWHVERLLLEAGGRAEGMRHPLCHGPANSQIMGALPRFAK
jgi:hypothetical protein